MEFCRWLKFTIQWEVWVHGGESDDNGGKRRGKGKENQRKNNFSRTIWKAICNGLGVLVVSSGYSCVQAWLNGG